MGQVVLFLQRHSGGMLQATDNSPFSYCWLLGTVTRWRAAKPTDITDSFSLPPPVSLLRFYPFHSSTEGRKGFSLVHSSWRHTLSLYTQIQSNRHKPFLTYMFS